MLVREQISQRDADLLYAATLMEQMDARSGNGAAVEGVEQIGFDAAILASRMKGVMGIRFFDPAGRFTDAFPATIQPQDLTAHTLAAVRTLEAHSDYRPSTPMSDVFIYLPSFATGQVERIPTLEVTVPLHAEDSEAVFGYAQFILEGHSIAAEYRSLDRHLAALAGQTLLIAGVLLGGMLWLVFCRVERLNEQLAAQNRDLSRANEELAMAARSSALGAVSAHLMHGLKNPLASLSRYVRDRGSDGSENGQSVEAAEDWNNAVAAARRMQALVDHTMEVLADARGDAVYEIGIEELAESVLRKVSALATQRGVTLGSRVAASGELSSRTANLIDLILVNLLENAIQATPADKAVTLEVEREAGRLVVRVRDEGPGFPAQLRSRLFLPCKSTREGGSGIGLSICKQLADHLGATLDLSEAPGGGCVFTFGLPVEPRGQASAAPASHTTPSG
jgi:signal transduction histidine kinase